MLSFVTIVYSKDLPLLQLQALSLARFALPEHVASIHVVLNDVDEAELERRVEQVLEAYGPLQSKVQILHGEDVLLGEGHCARAPLRDRILIENRFRIPFVRKGGWRGNNGYRMQQVLKLGAARAAASENMVILDTKNLFLRPVEQTDFFSPDGAARLPFIKVESEYHLNWLCQSLDALDVPHPDLAELRTTTFSTPFPVRRSLILALLDEINTRYGSVQALFASRRRPSEFMLLNAFCLKSADGYAPWFEHAEPLNIGLWPTYSQDRLAQLISELDKPDALSLGLHNRAVSNLPEDLRNRMFAALETRGICDRQVVASVLQQTADLTG